VIQSGSKSLRDKNKRFQAEIATEITSKLLLPDETLLLNYQYSRQNIKRHRLGTAVLCFAGSLMFLLVLTASFFSRAIR